MAIFSGTVRSSVLNMDTGLHVILPYDQPVEGQYAPCKVIYLLHGITESSGSWSRYSNVERYVREYGVAAIMPEVQRSFYTNMQYGLDYFTYVSSELPELCGKMFGISTKREDTFVAGLSMGGYGAMRCALSRPDRYAGVASFSGAVDLRKIAEDYLDDLTYGEFTATLGPEHTVKDEDDLFYLAKQAVGKGLQVMMTCGDQDYLLDMNRRFAVHLSTLGYDSQFSTWEGTHEWGFWDRSIQLALDFFFGG